MDEITREEVHVRRIEMRGFKRSDGMYEVEANLTDQKPFDFQPPSRDRPIRAGELIHDHVVRVVFSEDMVIREVLTTMRAWPYRECPGGGESLFGMVGVLIGQGWASEVRKRLPNSETCTHMKELMNTLASAAYQTIYSVRPFDGSEAAVDGRPRKIDSCYAYGASRELVLSYWPQFHRKEIE